MRAVLVGLLAVNRILESLTGVMLVLFGAIMVALLAVQVVGRYTLGYSAIWLVEGGQYSFVWVSMLGVALAYRRRAHVALEYAWHSASSTRRKMLRFLVNSTTILFAACLCYGGSLLVSTFGRTYMPGIGWSMATVYASTLVCGALLAIFAVERLVVDFFGQTAADAVVGLQNTNEVRT